MLVGGFLVSAEEEKREVAGAAVEGAEVVLAVVEVRRRQFQHDIHLWSTSRTLRSLTPR